MDRAVTYVHLMGHFVSGQPSIIQNHALAFEDVDGRPVRASWATSVCPFFLGAFGKLQKATI